MTRTRNGIQEGGVPENTNPFCVNEDTCIGDGILMRVAPQYFSDDGSTPSGDRAPLKVTAPKLSQQEAENLVRELYESDILQGATFAVKEDFTHIIPKDLQGKVYISRNPGELCSDKDVYLQAAH